jgi:negative elongation factor B
VAGFFSGSPKSRRQSAVIQKLADMIGFNVKLYDMTLQFLRTLFLRTRNVHYCTLRSELLMALHDRYRTIFVGADRVFVLL